MPNIVFKLATLDLSNFVRVAPDAHMDPAQGDMLEPAFSDSPLYEGQFLTSLHAKNKEMKIPLYLHPPTPPYTQDALNQLVQQVNQVLRPVTDFGATLLAEWKNAQASNSTFYTVQFGRFEPDFNFRVTEKGWLAGVLHLWVLPYGHTGTDRVVSTYAAPANQSGLQVLPASMLAAAGGGTVVGDLSPHLDLRVTTGSYTGDDGQVGIIAALPQPSYAPIIPMSSFIALTPSAIVQGASGAWASQYLAMDKGAGAGSYVSPAQFSFAVSPGSVYATDDNRVLGLVRARAFPFGLRAFDSVGNPLGPTVIASAMDGWQLVDYGTLRVPAWQPTALVTIKAFSGINYNASGMFAPPRAAPGWTKEHGPIFVVPNSFSIMDLDWNSPALAMDSFDSAIPSTILIGNAQNQIDLLGNTWYANAQAAGAPVLGYYGTSALLVAPVASTVFGLMVGSPIQGDVEQEMVVTWNTPSGGCELGLGWGAAASWGSFTTPSTVLTEIAKIHPVAGAAWFRISGGGGISSVAIPSFLAGQYHLKAVARGSLLTAYLWGPSGAYAGAASGAPLIATGITPSVITFIASGGLTAPNQVGIYCNGWNSFTSTALVESFRARSLASIGHTARDMLHLYQPLAQNTRAQTASGPELVDLTARQRGPVQAPILPVPSLGGGLLVASFPWDQGPANDVLNVDVRIRERFTYAR